tara:strand:- start:650 stop:1315 length:666 start_codon:yes stop_codon:yes gene_type:complete
MPFLKKNHKNYAINNRVKRLRMMSGLTRKQFSILSQIPQQTLSSWEDPLIHRSGITEKGAEILIKALEEQKIETTKEWIFFGEGKCPSFISHTENSEVIDTPDWDYQEAILRDIADFTKNNLHSCILQLKDDSMSPILEKGDYVGGIKPNNIKIDGMNCIIILNGEVLVRKIIRTDDKRNIIVSTLKDIFTGQPTETISLDNSEDIFAIVWYRKNVWDEVL